MKTTVQKLHEATMKILATTGMKYHHPEAIEILKKNGINVDDEGVARFTEEQVLYWIRKAPGTFTLYARNPEHNITVGGDHVNYAPGYGASLIAEKDGSKRTAHLDDYIKFAKLFQQNPAFHVNGGCMVDPDDIPLDDATLLMFYTAYTYSDKVMQVRSGTREQMETLMQMGIEAFGGEEEFKAKPRFMTIVNMNTPLQCDSVMTDTLLTFAKYRQPFVVASMAMAGTTSPITLAGTIALTTAEVLSGIVLAQMASPGTPVCFASQSTTSDLRNGSAASGSPEGALCYKYCAQLAKFYGLPCRGGGAVTDAKVVNAQAGYEAMMTFMTCNLNKMNYIIHSAGILDSYAAMSYEKLIMDFEVIDYVQRFLREFEVDEETVPLDVIDEVGREGTYISELHTIEFCRQEPLTPEISVRGSTPIPQTQLEVNIDNRLERMLSAYKKPELNSEITTKLRNILKGRGVSEELLAKIENS